MIVLDASAAVEFLLVTPKGREVIDRIADPAVTLHAPHLLSVEVAQVMRRLHLRTVLTAERADEALQDLAALDVARYDHEPLLPRIWELRDNLTAYDAAYVALAEVLGASLVTFDQRLAGASGHHAQVDLIV